MSLFKDNFDFYIKGGFSGMFGILISHPVDTIKTHIQSGTPFRNIKLNPQALYKGITAPLIGVGVEKAIVFGTFNLARRKYNAPIYLAGAISGFTASLIVTPYERLKIISQGGKDFKVRDAFNPKWLFKGLSATFTREVPGFAIYFSVYEALKYNFYTKYDNQLSYSSAFLFGGLSGVTAWIFIYPQDRIKTLIQMENNKNNNKFLSIAKNIYKNGGILQFYKGFQFAVLRAIMLHSGTFLMMEILTN